MRRTPQDARELAYLLSHSEELLHYHRGPAGPVGVDGTRLVRWLIVQHRTKACGTDGCLPVREEER